MKSYDSETIELKEIKTPDLKKKLWHLQIQKVEQSINDALWLSVLKVVCLVDKIGRSIYNRKLKNTIK